MTKRVLIIDDEEHIREVAALPLETVAEWTVLTAKNGREGVDVATREQFDAILLDVMMPEHDGPATLAFLQADPRTAEIPVIFLTAKVQSSEKERLGKLGARGLISKPFDPMTLAAEVEQILGWERSLART